MRFTQSNAPIYKQGVVSVPGVFGDGLRGGRAELVRFPDDEGFERILAVKARRCFATDRRYFISLFFPFFLVIEQLAL